MYDFSKSDVYAYDFLTRPDAGSQIGAFLNECGNRPGFVCSSTCSSLFSGATSHNIPNDPFDNVTESGTRQFVVGCSACSNISVSFPGLNDGDDPGESHVPDTDPDCFQYGGTPPGTPACGTSAVFIDLKFDTSSSNTLVAVWFAGHLAQESVWGSSGECGGDNCRASSIGGSPFSIQLSELVGEATIGNRTNQLQGGILPENPEAPTGTITVIKVVINQPPGSDWEFGGTLGSFPLPAGGGTLSFGALDAGTYTITETLKAGFTSSVSCDPQASATTSTSADVEIDDNEVTCTFTNTGPPPPRRPSQSQRSPSGA